MLQPESGLVVAKLERQQVDGHQRCLDRRSLATRDGSPRSAHDLVEVPLLRQSSSPVSRLGAESTDRREAVCELIDQRRRSLEHVHVSCVNS